MENAMKTRFTAIALLLVLLAVPLTAAAQETPVQIFRGLTTIESSVIGITPAMEAEGLYTRDIYDDIDRRMRGTRLLLRRSRTQPLATTGIIDPLLQVTTVCRPGSGGRQICHVTVELREGVSLVRDPAVRFIGAAWRNSWIGEVNRFNELRDRIESMVDQFVQDFNAVR
jgi:hypothetical protein